MSRSRWKGLYYAHTQKSLAIPIAERSSRIIPPHVNQTFQIYSGSNYVEILIDFNMVGCKFGELVNTRKKHVFKKKKKKKK